MPERRRPNTTRQDFVNNYPQQSQTQTRIVLYVTEQEQDTKEESEEETKDAEASLYIKELIQDWATVNRVRSSSIFKEINNVSIYKVVGGEFWVKTNQQNTEIDWLADTGSPRSFMQ